MTSNSIKIRSLILSALMVFSVFAGTVALTGSAAAGNSSTASDYQVSPSVASADEDVTHTWTVSTTGKDVSVIADLNGDGDVDSGEVLTTVTDGGSNDADSSSNDVEVTVAPEDLGVTEDGTYTLYIYEEDGTSDSTSGGSAAENGLANITTDGSVAVSSLDDSATLTVTDSDPLNSGSSYYGGQDVAVSNLSDGETYRVRQLNDDNLPGTLRRTLQATDGSIDFELDGQLSEGEFVIVNEDGDVVPINSGVAGTPENPNETNTLDADFEVVTQDLTAEFDEDTVGNSGTEADVEYEISSDVRTGYAVNISSQGDLDTDELTDIFNGATNNTSAVYEDDDTVTVAGDTDYDLNFTDINAGNYTFEANVTDTGASDADDIEVTDTGDSEADFGSASAQEARGDIVNITVEFDNTDTATLQVGDNEDDNYNITAEVVDDNEDGIAYVEFNSFYAGTGQESQTLYTNTDDEVNNRNEGGDFSDGLGPGDLGTDVLAASDYDMLVRSGGYDGTGEIDNEDSIATLTLSERSTDSVNLWRAPEDDFGSLDDPEAISEFADEGNLTQGGTIAEGDAAVIQITANGLEGVLQADSDGQVDYGTFQSELNDDQYINLTIEEDTAAANADPALATVANADNSNASVVYADTEGAGADNIYVVLDSENLTELSENFNHEDGDSYVANFTTWDTSDAGDSDLSSENVSVSDNIAVEDPEIEVDTNENDFVVLEAADDQELTGDTNLAPGTELTIRIRSDGAPVPFLEQPETTVSSDGTWSATADFDAENEGGNFTVTPRGSNNGFTEDSFDGYLIEATEEPEPTTEEPTTEEPTEEPTTEEPTAPPTTEEPTTEEPTTEEETTTMDMGDGEETTTMSDGDSGTEEATTGSGGPGFTAAIALIALVAAALLAVRRDN